MVMGFPLIPFLFSSSLTRKGVYLFLKYLFLDASVWFHVFPQVSLLFPFCLALTFSWQPPCLPSFTCKLPVLRKAPLVLQWSWPFALQWWLPCFLSLLWDFRIAFYFFPQLHHMFITQSSLNFLHLISILMTNLKIYSLKVLPSDFLFSRFMSIVHLYPSWCTSLIWNTFNATIFLNFFFQS